MHTSLIMATVILNISQFVVTAGLLVSYVGLVQYFFNNRIRFLEVMADSNITRVQSN